MIEYIDHPSFEKECAALRRFSELPEAIEALKRLLDIQFHPIDPKPAIGPGKIHMRTNYDNCVLWKVEMAVKGLRKNQSPRVWFGVQGSSLAFLCIGTHIDNYSDNELEEKAKERLSDIF